MSTLYAQYPTTYYILDDEEMYIVDIEYLYRYW